MSSLEKRLRIAVGQLTYEGNSQSPVVTELKDFENKYLGSGSEILEKSRDTESGLSGAIQLMELCDVEIVPLVGAYGGCGGYVRAEAYHKIRSMMLDAFRDAGPLDGVYLSLHGAFTAEGENDVDGVLLEDARSIVGDIPLAVSLDLHANITQKMAKNADIIIGFRHYPHDDAFDTGRRTAGLLLRVLRGQVKPTMKVRRTPMLVPCQNQRTKGKGPLVELHARARAWEYAGEILAASYFPVQHGLDFPDASYATVVITNNDPETADRIALELAKAAWERRHEFDVSTLSPEEAIAKGLKIEGEPIVLSEASDCVGGGASGDSAIVLKALLEFAGGIPATIMIVDPETVQAARDAGIGGRFQARIGSKHSAVYGEPVKAEAEVLRLYKDCRFTYSSGPAGGFEGRMGPTALLQVGSVQVVVPSLPTYEYADEQFIAVGVQPRNCKFVIVKNPMNFQQAFAYAPALISLDTPGPTTCHVRKPLWKNLDRPIYPIDDDFTPIFQEF